MKLIQILDIVTIEVVDDMLDNVRLVMNSNRLSNMMDNFVMHWGNKVVVYDLVVNWNGVYVSNTVECKWMMYWSNNLVMDGDGSMHNRSWVNKCRVSNKIMMYNLVVDRSNDLVVYNFVMDGSNDRVVDRSYMMNGRNHFVMNNWSSDWVHGNGSMMNQYGVLLVAFSHI